MPSPINPRQAATHLFEEPGTLEKVAELARDWFVRYLAPIRTGGAATRAGTRSEDGGLPQPSGRHDYQ
jgi:hypothetical protein